MPRFQDGNTIEDIMRWYRRKRRNSFIATAKRKPAEFDCVRPGNNSMLGTERIVAKSLPKPPNGTWCFLGCHRLVLNNPVVAFLLEIKRQLLVTRANDPAIDE